MIKDGRPITNEDGSIDDALVTFLKGDDLVKVFDWIRENLKAGEDEYPHASSYRLKHDLENDTGIYLTNNQYKDAMLLCGFKAVDTDELNWTFYLDQDSPLFVKAKGSLRDRFKKLRSEMSPDSLWSQTKFADFFHIPHSTYRKWEQGIAEPPEYVYGLINDISWYRDTLWKNGIPDEVKWEEGEARCTDWERDHTRVAPYTDFRIYDETGDSDCRSIRLYTNTLSTLVKNKEIFNDVIGTFFAKYGTRQFVTADMLISIIKDARQDLNGGFCYIFSVGPVVNSSLHAKKGKVLAVLYGVNNKGKAMKIFFPSDKEGTKAQTYTHLVWEDDGTLLKLV